MDEREKKRLSDYLRRTDSEQDGEALTSLRFARNLMRHHKMEWDDLIFQDKEVYKQPITMGEKLVFLRNKLHPSSSRFTLIDSFYQQWIRRGSLSEKQRALLDKFYEDIM